MKTTIRMMAVALTVFGIMAASSRVCAGVEPSPFKFRTPNFDYSICLMIYTSAPVSKLMAHHGTPIVLPASLMCDCVKNQVGVEAMEKIKCPSDISGAMPI